MIHYNPVVMCDGCQKTISKDSNCISTKVFYEEDVTHSTSSKENDKWIVDKNFSLYIMYGNKEIKISNLDFCNLFCFRDYILFQKALLDLKEEQGK